MKIRHYVLDADNRPVEADLMTWAQWWETASNRIVDWTQINSEVMVSTVFLGLDHRFGGKGPPLLFETMIFGAGDEAQNDVWRYSSWDDAKTGHAAVVSRLRADKKAPA